VSQVNQNEKIKVKLHIPLCLHNKLTMFITCVYSVAAVSDAGQYNCSFTLSTHYGRLTFTESIEVTGMSVLILIC